jgi:alpha-L-arabinofuranosidase
MQDCNSFENPDKIVSVAFAGAKQEGNKILIKLPATSVVVLALK